MPSPVPAPRAGDERASAQHGQRRPPAAVTFVDTSKSSTINALACRRPVPRGRTGQDCMKGGRSGGRPPLAPLAGSTSDRTTARQLRCRPKCLQCQGLDLCRPAETLDEGFRGRRGWHAACSTISRPWRIHEGSPARRGFLRAATRSRPAGPPRRSRGGRHGHGRHASVTQRHQWGAGRRAARTSGWWFPGDGGPGDAPLSRPYPVAGSATSRLRQRPRPAKRRWRASLTTQ